MSSEQILVRPANSRSRRRIGALLAGWFLTTFIASLGSAYFALRVARRNSIALLGPALVVDHRAPVPLASPAVAAASASPARCTADVAYSFVDRRELAALMQADDLHRFHLVPAIRSGRPAGFKVYAIRPGGVLDRMGLRNGDTLERIQGFDLSTPDKALEVYERLEGHVGPFTVELRRAGCPVVLVVETTPRASDTCDPWPRSVTVRRGDLAGLAAAFTPGGRIATLAALVRGGRRVGVKMSGMPLGSPLQLVGLRTGDVLLAAQGIRLSTDGRLAEIARLLARQPTRVTLDLEHAGCPVTLVINPL